MQLLTLSYTVPFLYSKAQPCEMTCPHRILKNKDLSYFHQWKINYLSLPQQKGHTWPFSGSIFLIISNSQNEKSIKIVLLLFNKLDKDNFPIEIKSFSLAQNNHSDFISVLLGVNWLAWLSSDLPESPLKTTVKSEEPSHPCSCPDKLFYLL